MEFLIKEYELTYDNYKYTFEQSLNVAKFFTTINSVFFLGFILRPDALGDATNNVRVILLGLVFLIIFGLISTFAQLGAIGRRRKCVHRMNYLRKQICLRKNLAAVHDEYCAIAGFTKMIDAPSYNKFGISSWLPLVFTGTITIALIMMLIVRFWA